MAPTPPGIAGNLQPYVVGGDEGTEWREFSTTRFYNTSVVVQGDKVRLALN